MSPTRRNVEARSLPSTHGNSALFLEDRNSNILQPFARQKFRAKLFRIKRAFSPPSMINAVCVIIEKKNEASTKKRIQIHFYKESNIKLNTFIWYERSLFKLSKVSFKDLYPNK